MGDLKRENSITIPMKTMHGRTSDNRDSVAQVCLNRLSIKFKSDKYKLYLNIIFILALFESQQSIISDSPWQLLEESLTDENFKLF